MPKPVFLLFFFLFSVPELGAQSVYKQQMAEKRVSALKKIKEIDLLLKSYQAKHTVAFGHLQAIRQKISLRKQLMLALLTEIDWAKIKMLETESRLRLLSEELAELKEEYGAMVYFSAKSGGAVERLSFLFSSKTLRQLLSRVQYIRQYQREKKAQMLSIQQTRGLLRQNRVNFLAIKAKKEVLHDSLSLNHDLLYELEEAQKEELGRLTEKKRLLEKRLAAELAALKRLDDAISEEAGKSGSVADNNAARIRKHRRDHKEGTGNFLPNGLVSRRDNFSRADNFSSVRGKVILPVAQGFISGRFGRFPHPVLKNVWVNNNGVDIETKSNAPVWAVYAGQVVLVTKIPGMGQMVLLQHGEYFTAYARLNEVSVRVGQGVRQKQVLGRAAENKQATVTVQFQIWKNQQKLNPEDWLE